MMRHGNHQAPLAGAAPGAINARQAARGQQRPAGSQAGPVTGAAAGMPPVTGRVISVNVGAARTIVWRGRTVTSGIWKQPVSGRITARGVNLAGDQQADRRAHGGPDKALYAYGQHDYQWWSALLERPLAPGTFGENLTIADLDPNAALIGERWQVGSALLEVAQPRVPCYKLGIRLGNPAFPRRFAAAGRPGAYLRILAEGDLGADDTVRVVHRPGHGVTVATVASAYHTDHHLVPLLLAVPQLSAPWHHWARTYLDKAPARRGRGTPAGGAPPPGPSAGTKPTSQDL